MSQVNDELLDHEYDGIREYDNPLPRWWLGIFVISVVFSVIYVPYYHFMGGPHQEDEYAAEMAAAAASAPKVEKLDEAALQKIAADPTRIQAGKALYDKHCVACHTADGGGLVGPNLTDKFWIHGGSLTDIVHTITEGVPEKGMISWKTQLSAEEIRSVAAFVNTLRGTTPANPKAPEGEPYEG
ncbi:MAG: c-type cytochrome [Myxococcales bacterium]|nr:c-type cytochrome [Myxococcales bacterium]